MIHEWKNGFPWATFGRRETTEEFFSKWESQVSIASEWRSKNSFSLIIPVTASINPVLFSRCLNALELQSYPHWKAYIIDGTGNPSLQKAVEKREDSRFVYVPFREGADALPSFAELPLNWVGVVEPEAVLSPVALFRFALEMGKELEKDVFFSHEVVLKESVNEVEGFFSKSQPSLFNLLHFNSVGKFWLVRASLLKNIRLSYQSREAEHRFLLEGSAKGWKFHLLPEFLYYGRKSPELEASPDLIPVIKKVAVRAFEKADVSVIDSAMGSRVQVFPHLKKATRITAVICFRDRIDITIKCLRSLESV